MNEQCLGITRNGSRCKITRNLIDGYCRLHRKNEPPDQTAEEPPAGNTPHIKRSPAPDTAPCATSSESSNFMVLLGLFCIFLLLASIAFRRRID